MMAQSRGMAHNSEHLPGDDLGGCLCPCSVPQAGAFCVRLLIGRLEILLYGLSDALEQEIILLGGILGPLEFNRIAGNCELEPLRVLAFDAHPVAASHPLVWLQFPNTDCYHGSHAN